jgi:hypothetical protein
LVRARRARESDASLLDGVYGQNAEAPAAYIRRSASRRRDRRLTAELAAVHLVLVDDHLPFSS